MTSSFPNDVKANDMKIAKLLFLLENNSYSYIGFISVHSLVCHATVCCLMITGLEYWVHRF